MFGGPGPGRGCVSGGAGKGMANQEIESLLAEASRLYNEGSYRQAIQKWQEVLGQDPANQKARESIKIASLLSDTWSESEGASSVETPAEPPSEEQGRLQEELARIGEKVAARDFQGALADCESLTAVAPDSEEIKKLADQARSGLESEPFIRAALERAARELKAGKFETVEMLCGKVLSLDAGNRQARTLLYMAQRRTAGAPETSAQGAEEGDEAGAAVQQGAGDPAPDGDAPLALPDEPLADMGGDPGVNPAQAQAPEAAADPLAALGEEMGGDLSPLDIGETFAALEANGAPAAVDYGTPAAAAGGEEVDASQIEAIPLGAPRPSAAHTHSGAELVQEGSIYEGPDPDAVDPGAVGVPASARAPGASQVGSDTKPTPAAAPLGAGGEPEAAPARARRSPAAPAEPAEHADSRPGRGTGAKPRPAPGPRAAAMAGAAARGTGSRLLRGLVMLVVKVAVLGAGVGLWIFREEIKERVWPSAPAPLQAPDTDTRRKPAVTPVSAPAEPAGSAAQGAGVPAPTPDVAAPAPPPVAAGGRSAPPAAPGGTAPVAMPAAAVPVAAAQAAAESGEELPVDPLARQELAQRRLAEAQRRLKAGKPREARVLLTSALELDPVLFQARDMLDKLEQQLQEEQRFEDDVQTVTRSFKDGDYKSALWKLYRMQDAFPTVRTWDRNITSCWYNWGVKMLKAGNCQEAAARFKEVLDIDPADRDAQRQLTVSERYLSRPKDAAYYSYVDALNLRPLLPIRK